MKLKVQGKQLDIGDALRTHVQDKLESINSKYFGRTVDADVTLAPEGSSAYKTQITMHVSKNIQAVGTAIEHDPYASFDQAAEKVAKQLRRYKKRLRDHHERQEGGESPIAAIAARDVVLSGPLDSTDEDQTDAPDNGDDPLIVAEMKTNIETLSVHDAVMRLDLSDAPVLLFHNAKDKKLNVVYRRPDGNIGWVEPLENGD